LQYTVNVTTTGSYVASFVVAAAGEGGTFHLEMNGVNVTGALTVPSTGGWQNWQTVTATVSLAAGPQIARLRMDTNGTRGGGNVDAMQFAPASSSSGTTIVVPPGGDLQGAIDRAQPGDTIVLTPGAIYSGGLILGDKPGSTYITIRSAAPDASLPAEGVRI